MRIGITAAFLAAICIGSAAAADPGAANIGIGTVGSPRSFAGTGISELPALRLGLVESRSRRRLDDPEMAVHRRLLGTMIDYYPLEGSGLHLSGGTLRGTRGAAGWQTQARIVTVGRRDFGFHSMRQRFVPTMTVGYSLPLAPAMQAGFEVGGASGGMNAMPSGPTSMFLGDSGMRRAHGASGMRAIANLAFGYRF